MTIKQFILVMILATIICWVALVAVLYYVNPYQANILGMGAFYGSLFLATSGTLGLVTLFFRAKTNKEAPLFRLVLLSFRQSLFLGFILAASFYLQSASLLTWWNAIILISAVSVMEMFFMSTQQRFGLVGVGK